MSATTARLSANREPLPGGDWLTRCIVFTPVVAATLLAKISLAPLGSLGIGVVAPLSLLALAIGCASSRLQLVPHRLVLYLLMLSALGLLQVLRGSSFSTTSLALMAAIAGCYVFAARDERLDAAAAMRFFGNLSLALAALGIGQFALQFVASHAAAFPIESYVPEAFRTRGFNNVVPLYWGSDIYKSNAFVMLEPSEFSQLCAIGLIVELSGSARLLRLLVYTGALIVTYSGTGLIVLAVALPLLAILQRRWNLLLPGVLVVAIGAVFADTLRLDTLMNRMSEFSSPGSSGFARFVGWRELFAEQFWPSTTAALFGHGAGSFYEAALRYSAAEMSYSKIIFEFGVLGGLVYFCFLFYCLFSVQAPLPVRVAVAVSYLMNGAYAMSVASFTLSLLLWPHVTAARRTEPKLAGAHA